MTDQRRLNGSRRCFAGTIRTTGHTDTHQGSTGVAHDCAHIGEVEVDQTRRCNQVTDALHTLTQNVIGDLERVDHGDAAIEDLQQAVVGDCDQRVDVGLQHVDARIGLGATLRTLETEWRRHNANRQGTHFASDTRHDRGCTRSGATALASGDKNEVGTLQRLADFLFGLFCRFATNLGSRTRAEALGEILTNVNTRRCLRRAELLSIRVDGNKLDVANARFDHPIDGIDTRATNTNNANYGEVGVARDIAGQWRTLGIATREHRGGTHSRRLARRLINRVGDGLNVRRDGRCRRSDRDGRVQQLRGFNRLFRRRRGRLSRIARVFRSVGRPKQIRERTVMHAGSFIRHG